MNQAKIVICITLFLAAGLIASATVQPSSGSLPSNTSIEKPVHSKKVQLRITQMKWYVSLTTADYEKWKGKKLNFIQKASFKLSHKRMKKMLKHYEYGGVTTLQKISWLGKGLILGPIAVLLAYLFLSEDEAELIKWTWFGFAGWVVIVGTILLFA